MKFKLLEKTERKIVFAIEDTNPAFANALRRIMTSEIPVMSVEYADIENNTSGMFDEAVAHRLGMIQLAFSYTYKLHEDCKCGGKGCSQCESVFVIDKEGPCT